MSIELFRRSTDYARAVMAELTPDDLRLPTPCPGWDVGMVVLHLADVSDALVRLLETGDLTPPEPPREDHPDPVTAAREGLAELDQALLLAADAATAERAAASGTIEVTVHGWDISVGCRPGRRMPEQLAADVWTLATSLIEDGDRGANFAGRVDVPPGAPMGDQLAAFLGRMPRTAARGTRGEGGLRRRSTNVT